MLPCPPDPPALVADQGALLSPAGGCSAWVIETRPADSLFSWAGARVPGDVAPAFEVSLVWRRLGESPEAPLEIAFPGGTWMVRDGAVGWWEDDAHWAVQGWHPLAIDTGDVHAVRLVQRGRTVRAWIDGVEVPSFQLFADPAPGRLSIGLKGLRNDRAQMWIDRVVFTAR